MSLSATVLLFYDNVASVSGPTFSQHKINKQHFNIVEHQKKCLKQVPSLRSFPPMFLDHTVYWKTNKKSHVAANQWYNRRRLHRARWLGTGKSTVSRKTANKKLTKLYWPSQKRSPNRLIVLAEPKKVEGHNQKKIRSGATEWYHAWMTFILGHFSYSYLSYWKCEMSRDS